MATEAMMRKLKRMHLDRQNGASFKSLARRYNMQICSVYGLLSRFRRGDIKLSEGTRWTEAMDALLVKHWKTRNGAQIAKLISKLHKMEVSDFAVNARANRLGLRKPGSPHNWWMSNMDPWRKPI